MKMIKFARKLAHIAWTEFQTRFQLQQFNILLLF
jgi:hypothetical protein